MTCSLSFSAIRWTLSSALERCWQRAGVTLAAWLIALSGAVACHPMGARTIPVARFDYNEAIVQSFDSQMLLNLVRLRYQDSIMFLDLGSVVASYNREFGGGVSATVGIRPEAYGGGVRGDAKWSETPTISYAPLQGEDFARRLLEPIRPSAILLLSRSGWGLERLLLCAVQQLNELVNGTAIGGVAPVQVLHYERFLRVALLLRSLQEDGNVQLNTLSGEEGSVVLTAGPFPMGPEARAKAQEVIQLLALSRPEDGGPIPMEADSFPRSPATIVLSGRSFLGVMTFLAQHVEVPHEHVRSGLVRTTLGPDGKPFDWQNVTRGLFRVRSGSSKPKGAYLAVKHRGHWFWIDDRDIESKGTYTLLSQLFSLQAASDKIRAPVLTIPAR